jgi:hypothetical protein
MINKCAAVLADEKFRLEFPMYIIGESKQAIEQVFEDISLSTFTPEQKASMLGYLRHEAMEVMTEEEVTSLFKETELCDTPAYIPVDGTNYPLIYKSLEHISSLETIPAQVEVENKEEEVSEAEVPAEESDTTTEDTTESDETVVENAAVVQTDEVAPPEAEESAELVALKAELAAHKSTIESLRSELVTYKSQERDSKLNGIVEMLIDMQKPLAVKYKEDKNEILAVLMTRTQESLDDLYEDLLSEQESYGETLSTVIPEVKDPTLGAPEAANIEATTEELHSSITEDEASIETYSILLGEDKALKIFQVSNTK